MYSATVDVRAALRQMGRARAQWALIVAALAAGVGANTTVFWLTRAVMLHPLPYREPSRLVVIWRMPSNRPSSLAGIRDPEDTNRQISTSQMVLRWRDNAGVFDGVAALESWQTSVGAMVDIFDSAGVERHRGAFVTPNFFNVLGVDAALGSTFGATDNSESDVVISDAMWRRRFGADERVIGQTLELAAGRERERRRVRIIGVLPRDVQFTYPRSIDLWMSVSWRAVQAAPQQALRYVPVARMRSGVSVSDAAGALRSLVEAEEVRARVPDSRRTTVWLENVHDYAVSRFKPFIALLAVVSALVFGFTVVNVSAQLSAYTASHIGEMHIRRALGATRWLVLRPLLVQCAVCACLAAATVCGVLWIGQPILRWLLPLSVPRVEQAQMTAAVAAVASLLAALSVLAASLGPAALATHSTHVGFGLATGARVPGRPSSMLVFVVLQAALVSALLATAGALLQSFWNLQQVPLGFDERQVLAAEMRFAHPRYRDSVALLAAQNDLLERVRAVRGVEVAALTSSIPFYGVDWLRVIDIPNQSGTLIVNERQVDGAFFAVLRIPLVSGRLFSGGDTQTSQPVAAVSAALADKLYPGQTAVGRRLEVARETQIVAVVGDVRTRGLDRDASLAVYVPRQQAPGELVNVVARGAVTLETFYRELQQAVRAVDPAQPIQRVARLESIVSESVAERRFLAVAGVAWSVIVVFLAAAGTAGMMVVFVASRRRELGVRAALGASSRGLETMFVRQGTMFTLGGVVGGLVLSVWCRQLLSVRLFNVAAFDGPAMLGVGAAVVAIGALACYLPVRQAVRENVTICIRE